MSRSPQQKPQSAPHSPHPSSSMAVDTQCAAPFHPPSSFVPRPFPPPSLANVPLDFIVDRLHQLALNYWDKPETADCTIIVPIVPGSQGRPTPNTRPLSPPASPPLLSKSPDPAGLGRRATEPMSHRVSRITSKLHMDYLSAQSTLLRSLFTGSCPLDLMGLPTPTSPTSCNARRPSFPAPVGRIPRLMPSPPNKPTVYLPLPDPSSFPHLVHYMYFGTTSYIEDCLNRKVIRWEGVVRNVEYLGMRTDIKVFLGRWYGNWLAPSHLRMHFRPPSVEEGDESDDSGSDSDDDDEYHSCGSDSDADWDSETSETETTKPDLEPEDDPPRGRTRERRSAIVTGSSGLHMKIVKNRSV